ncbi:MAG: adenylyl-sulfate kinase [Desulfurococcaceae archaeon]
MRCLEKGVVVWLTGLPAAGKTTIATLAAEKLKKGGFRVEVLDGDWMRSTISAGVGFTREERRMHLIKAAWIARMLASHGVVVLAAFVSPYRDVRAEVRKIVEEGGVPFVEVYVKVPLEVAMSRDKKGLYARALRGEIKNFTGVDDPYEEPEAPELILDNVNTPLEVNIEKIIQIVERLMGR